MASETLQPTEFRLLRDYIQEHCGILLGDEKTYLVETRLYGLAAELGCPDFGALYRLAAEERGTALRDRIVDAMTTHETLWFRDGHPFATLREVLLPELERRLREGSRFRIRIWSAAASTGQEAYSIAMTILEYCRQTGLGPERFEILATDISPSALFLAKAGRYDAGAMARGLPEPMKERYFRQENGAWILDEAARRMVSFRKFNLQDPLDPLGCFDIVFCRYVTIYFADAFKRRIYAGMARTLFPAGALFISAVENLNGVTDAFESISHGPGTYYRRRAGGL